MLANLLDGHPEVLVYPWDLTLLYAYFPDFLAKQADASERRARLGKIVFDELRSLQDRIVDPSIQMNVDAMATCFFESLRDEELSCMRSVITALAQAFSRNSGQLAGSHRYVLFKETSCEIYAHHLFDWFPDLKFVRLVRDPRDNYSALKAGVDGYYAKLSEGNRETLMSLLHRVSVGHRIVSSWTLDGDHPGILTVRYEDIVSDIEQSMANITKYLGIEMSEALLSPTILGMPVSGNNFDGEDRTAVSARNVMRWDERIDPEEARIIEFHLGDVMRELGYPVESCESDRAAAASEFYKWANYRYFYSDRFDAGLRPDSARRPIG